ncbi:MAG: hypothetical protein QX203_08250 [Methylococcaceae bacterium]
MKQAYTEAGALNIFGHRDKNVIKLKSARIAGRINYIFIWSLPHKSMLDHVNTLSFSQND